MNPSDNASCCSGNGICFDWGPGWERFFCRECVENPPGVLDSGDYELCKRSFSIFGAMEGGQYRVPPLFSSANVVDLKQDVAFALPD